MKQQRFEDGGDCSSVGLQILEGCTQLMYQKKVASLDSETYTEVKMAPVSHGLSLRWCNYASQETRLCSLVQRLTPDN